MWGQAAVSLACALPAIGTFVSGVTRATKLAKAGTVIGKTMQYAGKAYMTVQTATQALELAGDARMQYAINGGKMTWDIAKKAVGAAALGALSVMSAGNLMKDVTSLTKMPEMEFHTTVRETADEGCGRYDENGFPRCFIAGTKVKTYEGDKNIEDIEEGDYVLSEDPETGEQGYRKVLQTFVNEKHTLVHVYIEDEEIVTTDGHPFYVEGAGFIPSEELKPGDLVRLADGRTVPVISIEIEYLDEPVLVYNFEVENSHTYYVSELGVLVHNTGCPKDTPAEVETIAMPSKVSESGSKTPDITTGAGYGASDPPVRIDGEWTINDMKQALLGHSPRGLGNPDIHHGGQMPGGSLHEVLPNQHRNNSALHPNLYNQGVTNEMRVSDRQLHWWYRAREQGADELLPNWIYDD